MTDFTFHFHSTVPDRIRFAPVASYSSSVEINEIISFILWAVATIVVLILICGGVYYFGCYKGSRDNAAHNEQVGSEIAIPVRGGSN